MPRAPAASPPLTPASAVSSKKRKLDTDDGSVKVEENAPEDAIMTPETTASPAAVKTEPVVPVTHDNCLPKLAPTCLEILKSRNRLSELDNRRIQPYQSGYVHTTLWKNNVTEIATSIITLEELLAEFQKSLIDSIEKEDTARRKKMEKLEREAALCLEKLEQEATSCRQKQQLNESFREKINDIRKDSDSSVSAPDLQEDSNH